MAMNVTDFLLFSTDLFISTSFYPEKTKRTKRPKAPKAPKTQKGPPSIHMELLELKQSLSLISLTLISILFIYIIIRLVKNKQCRAEITERQLKHREGRIFFSLFIIAFGSFLSNSAFFTAFIFNLESISFDLYSILEILSIVPYQIGKFAMTLFLILRLHFVFKDTTLIIRKWIIVSLIVFLAIAVLLGCVSGIAGPLRLIPHDKDSDMINPAQLIALISVIFTIFVDIVVMVYYVQRLQKLTIMEGSVEERTRIRSKSGKQIQYIIEIEPRDSGKPTVEFPKVVVEKEAHIDHEFVNTMTRSTLLSLIGLCSTFWLYAQHFVMAINGESDGVMFRAIACFDGAINLICMYMLFSFAKPTYDIGCRVCHNGMSFCCVWLAEKAVLRKNIECKE